MARIRVNTAVVVLQLHWRSAGICARRHSLIDRRSHLLVGGQALLIVVAPIIWLLSRATLTATELHRQSSPATSSKPGPTEETTIEVQYNFAASTTT
jgi:hypothetical protein